MTERTLILIVYLAAVLVAVVRVRKHSWWAKAPLAVPSVAVYLFCSRVFAVPFMAILEAPYSPALFPADEARAVVVLTSKVYGPDVERPLPLAGEDTYERSLYAAWLYNHWRRVPILASGGYPGQRGGDPPYADAVRRVLRSQGVPEDAISIEAESRNTYESARNSAAILRRKGIAKVVLVTEAYHMLRAELAFRRQGLQVVPAPCGFRSRVQLRTDWLLPESRALAWTEDGAHEMLGLAWYLVRGRV